MRLLNALNSEDRGLKVRFSLATIVFETFELILCQMLFSAFSSLKEVPRKILQENPRENPPNFIQQKSPTTHSLKTLTSLNKEVRPFFLGDNSIWSFPSVSSLSDYSIWRF